MSLRCIVKHKYKISENQGERMVKIGQHLANIYGQRTIAYFLGPPCVAQNLSSRVPVYSYNY